MALSEEKRADLEDAVAPMRMLAETVGTDGWQKIILPHLIDVRKAAFSNMPKVESMDELYKLQAAIEAVDLFVSDDSREPKIESEWDRRIREGVEAVEVLSKEKE